MKYKLVYTRLQSLTESKRSNAFRSCFWRTSMLYPSWWWCKFHFKTISKIIRWKLWHAKNAVEFALDCSIIRSFKSGVGNLSLVAGQRQILQGLAGRINFPPTIPFP